METFHVEHPPGRSAWLRNVGAQMPCIGRHWEALGVVEWSWSVALPMSLQGSGGGRSGTETECTTTFADLCRPLQGICAGPHKRSQARSAWRVFHPPIIILSKTDS